MDLNLQGRHALVCGASQGIGLASAQALAAMGASVTLLARNAERLAEALPTLPAEDGQSHQYLVADFGQPQDVATVVSGLVGSHPVQILVNNTGGPPGGPLAAAGTDELLAGFDQHVLCNQLLLQAVLPGMREAGWGRVINIISTSVKQPIPGLGVSNTIRGAVASWAKTLATELGPLGITVNNVLPGFTATARLDSLIRSKAEAAGVAEQQIADSMRASVPMNRFAEADEVANGVAFLASPAASYINGINLPVDGGRTGSL